ncbi:bifunctional 3,4-dihydroxy-2-butanone-4-phosphate synthase/GTP cyclohydrolase II [Xanthomonadaceae bacterium JHOS43]|nr:bifunctional 3,4-dihydroxy-2-butanone-4-phosphate synthase/GTP cyclohydrolase II [Xanthomonadaceae bacterium JHOS43]
MSFATIPELIEDIRAGRMVVVVDDEDRENEGDLVMAASLVRPEDINFMVTHGRGLVCLPMTTERCERLGLPLMARDNRSQFRTAFTVSIEAAQGVTTGISAADRAHTIQTAVKADAAPDDLHQPGHIFPLIAQPGGVLRRAGHTEAAVDLARLAGLEPAGVIVEILNPDGTMARRLQLEVFAREHGLKIGSIADLIQYRLRTERGIERVDEREVQTDAGPFRLVSYRDLVDGALHFALVHGDPAVSEEALVRVHVENVLTDLLHLEREDFGITLSRALRAVREATCGVVVVLSETPGPEHVLARLRGDAQSTSSEGPTQWRRNGVGAQILADLGARRLRVLGTPRRQVALAGFGLELVGYVEKCV